MHESGYEAQSGTDKPPNTSFEKKAQLGRWQATKHEANLTRPRARPRPS